jgi:hypothetical protein
MLPLSIPKNPQNPYKTKITRSLSLSLSLSLSHTHTDTHKIRRSDGERREINGGAR